MPAKDRVTARDFDTLVEATGKALGEFRREADIKIEALNAVSERQARTIRLMAKALERVAR